MRHDYPDRRRETGPAQLDRGDGDEPTLRWLSVEDPAESFVLRENDYVLDSHYNTEFDTWEVLVRLEPDLEE